MPSAVEVILSYRQLQDADSEAGGLLLGRFFDSETDVIVDEATRPMRKDRRSRFAFWRPRSSAQKTVNLAWRRSEGTRNFLGEWHTHPEGQPRPSDQDTQNWRRIAAEAQFEQHSLLFAIAGVESIGVWEVDRTGEIFSLWRC